MTPTQRHSDESVILNEVKDLVACSQILHFVQDDGFNPQSEIGNPKWSHSLPGNDAYACVSLLVALLASRSIMGTNAPASALKMSLRAS
jgi:hypothetical protein